jgi:hypothetical protein
VAVRIFGTENGTGHIYLSPPPHTHTQRYTRKLYILLAFTINSSLQACCIPLSAKEMKSEHAYNLHHHGKLMTADACGKVNSMESKVVLRKCLQQ